MMDAIRVREEETLPEGAALAFRTTAFVLGPFPAISQTFIHREFEAMVELGLDVNVVSTCPRRRSVAATTDTIRALQRDALYLGYNSPRVMASIGGSPFKRKVRRTIRWMQGFPHRTHSRRVRAVGAALAAAQLAPDLARRGIRYVHSHFAGFQTEVAMCLSHLLEVPYGCTWHATGIYQDRNILEQKIAGAERVITCTQHNVDHLRRLYPDLRDRIHLAYHGLDLTSGLTKQPIAADDLPLILAVGRFVPKKGFAHLIRAAALLREQGCSFAVQIIGDGPDRSALETLIRDLGLSAVVALPGTLPTPEVLARMATARVLAVPSVEAPAGDLDGLPNVALEAMSMARPVVASRISGIPEVVRSGETGLLFEPGNTEELASQLGVLLDDPHLARMLGENARDLVRREFDVRRNVRHVIRHIANGRRKS